MITNGSIANIPYIGALPTTVTNFGGRTQVCVNENPYTPTMQVFGGQGAFNAAPAPRTQPNPYAIINGAQGMLAEVFNKMASSNIDSALGAVTTQKNQLIAKYNSGNASESVKSIIQAHVKELEKYEYQLNYLKSNAGQVDPQTAYQRSEYLKNTVMGIINLGTTTIKGLEVQSSQAAQSASEVSEAQGQKPEDETIEAKAAKVKEDNIYTRAGEEDLDKDAVNTQYYDQLIEDLHDSMFCWGTKDAKFEAALDKINKENVIELMYIWNQKYPNESFMEAFMADAGPIQKKEYGVKIATALEQAGAELGIDLSKDEDMVAIKKEMDSLFWINNSVADNYNNVVKKLLATAGVEYNYSPYSMFSK